MLADFKLGLGYYKYGQGARSTMLLLYMVLLMDIVINVLTDNMIVMDIFMLLVGLFMYQMVLSLDVSEMIATSRLRKKFQTTIPMMFQYMSFVFFFGMCLLSKIVGTMFFGRVHDVDIKVVCVLAMALMVIYGLDVLLYKAFEIVVIIIFLAAIGIGMVLPYMGDDPMGMMSDIFDKIGLGTPVYLIVAIVLIPISAFVNLKLANALYKKEISRNVFTSTYKRCV